MSSSPLLFIDRLLASSSSFLSHPISIFFHLQGCVICLFLALGWMVAASVRKKELNKIKKAEQEGNSFSFLYPDINNLQHSVQKNLPRVSVIMPVKGVSEYSISNWRTQIISLYGGALEFFFVVESKDDAAYAVASELVMELQGRIDARVIIAGYSTTCSQKIHNQLAGISAMHKETQYVLFLDDDVRIHPGTIGALVSCMQEDPKIFVLTGYPFDIPSNTLGSYCMFEYHMPCSMGFATGGRTFFLWGGCMMMHADDFREDRYGMVTGLRYGGYSDDMTLAAVAGANKRTISSPPVAIFIHPLAKNITFLQYWNYLRKQTFVLESYNTRLLSFLRRISGSPYVDLDSSRIGIVLACCHLLCALIEMVSLWNISRVEIDLCNALSPEQEHFSIKSYNWFLVFCALIVDNFFYPVSAVYSHCTQYIDWSGVRYHLRNGKISKIDRTRRSRNPSTTSYTECCWRRFWQWPSQRLRKML